MKRWFLILLAFLFLTKPAYAVSDGVELKDKVLRVYDENRYTTAIEASRKAFKLSDKVILAKGEDFPDALTGTTLANFYNAPILLTRKDTLNKETLEEIKRLETKEVFLLGGTEAFSQRVEDDLGKDIKVTRLAGKDRVETSKIVFNHLVKNFEIKGVGIASGRDFPDALAASPYLAKERMGLLLVNDKSQIEKENLPQKRVVFGGEEAVSKEISDHLKAERIGGKDRYETAFKIWKASFADSETIVFASGRVFPDALTAFPIAKKENAPILLLKSKDQLDTIYKGFEKVKRIYIMGEEAAIGGDIERRAGELIKDTVAEKINPIKKPTSSPYVQIKDPALRTVINKNIDPNRKADQKITYQEMRDLKKIDIDYPDGTGIIPLNKIEYEEGKEPLKDQMVKRELYSLEGLQYASSLESLDISETYIEDIAPLSSLKNLKYLELDRNNIKDVKPLRDLVKLEHLKLYNNYIQDISPLENLVNLKYLDVHYNVDDQLKNGIIDISPVKNMPELELLDISANSVEDITPMKGLKKIKHLDMSNNRIKDIRPFADEIYNLLYKMLIEEASGYSVSFMGQKVSLDGKVVREGEKALIENPYKGYDTIAEKFELPTLFEALSTDTPGVSLSYLPDSNEIQIDFKEEKEPEIIDRISLQSYSLGFSNFIERIEIDSLQE